MSRTGMAARLRYAFRQQHVQGGHRPDRLSGPGLAGLITDRRPGGHPLPHRPGGDGEPPGFVEAMWLSLMRTLDSGTMGGDAGRGFRVTMLFVTLGGIFIVSALIGVLNSGIEAKLDELRKGRSFVVESDHTLILGWSPKIFTILSELVARQREPAASRGIVILAEKDKVEMEDEIRDAGRPTPARPAIICRTGQPARPDRPGDRQPARRRGRSSSWRRRATSPDSRGHQVDPRHHQQPAPAARALPHRGRDRASRGTWRWRAWSAATRRELVAHRRPDLAHHRADLPAVGPVGGLHRAARLRRRRDLLPGGAGAGGQDLRRRAPRLRGLGAHGPRFRDGAACSSTRRMDTRIEAGDKVIAISEDDDTVRVSGAGDRTDPIDDDAAIRERAGRGTAARSGRCSSAGTSAGATIVNELDHYVAPGSELTRGGRRREAREAASPRECGDLAEPEGHRAAMADTTDRARARRRSASPSFDHVILLCYSDTLDVAGGRRAHAHHPAPPARHGGEGRARLPDRQRDAGRPEPRAGRGHAGRRLHRQQQADQPDARAGLGEQGARRGVRRPVRSRRARRSTSSRRATTSSWGAR